MEEKTHEEHGFWLKLTLNAFIFTVLCICARKQAFSMRIWAWWRSRPTRCPKCYPGSESLRRISGKKKASSGLNTHTFHLIRPQYCWHLHVPPSWRAGCWGSPCPMRSMSSKKSELVCRLAMPRNLKKNFIYIYGYRMPFLTCKSWILDSQNPTFNCYGYNQYCRL